MKLLTTVTLSLACCLWFTGCSQEPKALPVDTKPFAAAIAEYCAGKGFGMKVYSVERVEPKGETAIAVCKMEEAEATTTIKVRWEFTFRRTATGWQVESHTAK